MIWLWLYQILLALRALLWLPPAKPRKLDPNSACPACGATDGMLICRRPGMMPARAEVSEPCKVEHGCNVCGGRWFENTIVDDRRGELIHPANAGFLNLTQGQQQ